MSDREAFRKSIEEYLNRGRINQGHFADQLGYTREHVSRILHGKAKMPEDFVHSAVRVLAELECIHTRGQARKLLRLMDTPDFSLDDWKAKPLAALDDTPSSDSTVVAEPPPVRGTLLQQYDVHASYVVAVTWDPNGTRIASAGGDGTVRVWEAETGQTLLTYRGHTHWLNKINRQITVYTVSWGPKGDRIASAGVGANVRIWDVTTGQTLTLYEGHSGLSPYVFAVAWSPDGKKIASACSSPGLDKTIHLWDAVTGQRLNRYDVPSDWLPNFSVLSLAWSPDGTRIAATCGHNVIRVWNTETGQLVSTQRGGSEWVHHIAWSPDSRYLAVAQSDHKARVWDMSTGTNVTIYHEHKDSVRYIAWSPDGTALATASNDRTVHIWEPLTGKRLFIYKGHSDWATSVDWSPDGTRIASASNDKTVHIWQAGDDR
jgi:WD40 repeat protein